MVLAEPVDAGDRLSRLLLGGREKDFFLHPDVPKQARTERLEGFVVKLGSCEGFCQEIIQAPVVCCQEFIDGSGHVVHPLAIMSAHAAGGQVTAVGRIGPRIGISMRRQKLGEGGGAVSALEIRGLTRLYRNGRGIRDVDLSVAEGEVFGFLGPNGAGKTTLIRTVMGFLTPQAGTIRVLGVDALAHNREMRKRVGYLPSDPALYDFLTGLQTIEFSLRVRGLADRGRVAELARRLDVDLDKRLKTLSRGSRQKVALVAALAHDPDLLILDEPTTGLDPLVQETFAELVREERSRGKTVFMSSHVLSEVESLCDRVAIIRDGRIVAVDTVAGLKRRRVKYVRVEFAETAPDLSTLLGIRDYQVEGNRVQFTWAGGLDPLVQALSGNNLVDLTVSDPPLEEVFRAFYGGGEA